MYLDIATIDRELEAILAEALLPEPLAGACRHAVLSGGKRVRPMFCLQLAADLGAGTAGLLRASCALELLHCSSLVHDDLPALDNDDMRRGRPSCHKAFGEATAILAGDALITLGFAALASSNLAPPLLRGLVAELSRAFSDVCAGQQLDLLNPTAEADLLRMEELKTAAMFRASARFAAIAAGLDARAEHALSACGFLLGKAFQLVDDFLDLFGSDQVRGRNASSDQRNHKHTHFTDGSREQGMRRLHELHQCIESAWSEAERVVNRPLALSRETPRMVFARAGI